MPQDPSTRNPVIEAPSVETPVVEDPVPENPVLRDPEPPALAAAAARERRRDRAWLAAVALVVVVGALRGGLALDDRELLEANPVVRGTAPWWSAFTRDYFDFLGGAGQWRPLSSLSLRLDRALFGGSVRALHLVGAGLHLAVVVLALAWTRALRVPAPAARAGLTLFAVHPLLTDSVVWIAGRTSMLGALGPLLAGAWLLPRVRAGRARAGEIAGVAGAGVLAGMLGKEEAVVFVPALALAVAGARRGAPAASRRLVRAALAGGGLALLVALAGRALALDELLPAARTPALGDAPLAERLLTGGNALLEAARLAVLPLDHPPRYRAGTLLALHTPPGPALSAVLGWTLAAAPILVGAARLLRRPRAGSPAPASGGAAAPRESATTDAAPAHPARSAPASADAGRVAAGGALLGALALWPLTQVVPLGEVLAPRFLYLPLLLAAPAAGLALARLAGRRAHAATALLLVVLGAGFVHRAAVYGSPLRWHGAMLAHHPDDAPTWNALGLAHEEAGRIAQAEAAWRRAIELDAGHSKAWSNLGRVQLERGELDAAERSLRGAVEAGPRNAVARVNLAALLSRQGRLEEAAERYREAVALAPGLAPAWRGLGLALTRLERAQEAREALERALALDPGDRRAQTLLRRLDGVPLDDAPPPPR